VTKRRYASEETNDVATELLILLRIDLTAEAEHAEIRCGRDLLYLAVFSQSRSVYNAVDDEIEGIQKKNIVAYFKVLVGNERI
jgi:hypothetical protein